MNIREINAGIYYAQQRLDELIEAKNALLNNPTTKVIDQAIDVVRQREVCVGVRSTMHVVYYMKCFKTASVNLGRGAGHTSYITTHASANDIVVTHNTPMVKEHKLRNPFCTHVYTASRFSSIDRYKITAEALYQCVVYIDCASLLSAAELDEVYRALANRASYFVLLG